MAQIIMRTIIAGLVQTARGAAGSPVLTANYLEASGIGHPKEVPIEVPNDEFSVLDTPAVPQAVDPVWETGEDEFAVRLASAAGSALPIGFLLQAAGLKETLVAATSATYNIQSIAPLLRKVVTIDKYVDGEKFSLMDVVAASASFGGKVGEPLNFSFSGSGIANGTTPSAVAFPTAATASSTQARLIMQAASIVTQDAAAIPVEEFSLDLGVQIDEFHDTVNGHGFEVLKLVPELTIKKLSTVASADWAKARAAAAIAFIATFGSGRTLVFNMPKAVPKAPERSDTNSRLFNELTCSLHDSSGDDAFSIAAT